MISTEASLIADQERWGDIVDIGAGEELPDELFELGIDDHNGGRIHGEQTDGSVSMGDTDPLASGANTPGQGRFEADGGMVYVADNAAIYDLRLPEGFDGIAIDVQDADDFDPYPVTREDAKAAAEWFERSVDDGTDTWVNGLLVGIIVSVVLATIFLGGPWLAGQIAGGSGGAGENLTGTLPLLAVGGPAGARAFGNAILAKVRFSLEEVAPR